MLEEGTFGDANEALSAEARQREKIIESMENYCLIERLRVCKNGDANVVDLDGSRLRLDGGIEKSEYERVEDAVMTIVSARGRKQKKWVSTRTGCTT